MIDQASFLDTVIYCFHCQRESNARNNKHQLKKWCSANCANAYRSSDVKRCRSSESIHRKEYSLRRIHGITFADYDAKLESQEGQCALCNFRDKGRNLSVDHDHATDRNRGLLCKICNLKLGWLEMDIEWPARAISYLYHYKSFPGNNRPPSRIRPVVKPRPRLKAANVGDTNVKSTRVLGQPRRNGGQS